MGSHTCLSIIPLITRSIRLSCPKNSNSFAKTNGSSKLTVTQQEQCQASLIDHEATTFGNSNHQLQEESMKKELLETRLLKPKLI
jgi:hypothetical protein